MHASGSVESGSAAAGGDAGGAGGGEGLERAVGFRFLCAME